MEELCPQDVKDRGFILYGNGFHGWQEPRNGVQKNIFIFCFCDSSACLNGVSEKLEEIKTKSGSSTLQQDD